MTSRAPSRGPLPEVGAVGYREELRARGLFSALLLGVTALIVVPAWTVFDQILEPEYTGTFLRLRLLCDLPLALGVWSLRRTAWARQRPELVAYVMLTVVQVEIAWMVVRARDAREFYLLGFSLALYASGCLLAGPVRWTLALVATTWGALGLFAVTAPQPLSGTDLAACGFYLFTASLIAVLAHAQRSRLTAREFATRSRLEQEQLRNSTLLAQLERHSLQDSLTGLANRRRWDAALSDACATARREGGSLALVLMDVDRFKQINDLHGHASGDQALRAVAAVVADQVGVRGLVARIGGDELAVLLPRADANEAVEVAEQVRLDMLRHALLPGGHVRLSLSLGVSAASGAQAKPAELMALADHELYRAKETRNCVSAAGHRPPPAVPSQRDASERPVRS